VVDGEPVRELRVALHVGRGLKAEDPFAAGSEEACSNDVELVAR